MSPMNVIGLVVLLAGQASACADLNVNCTAWSPHCANTTDSWPGPYTYSTLPRARPVREKNGPLMQN